MVSQAFQFIFDTNENTGPAGHLLGPVPSPAAGIKKNDDIAVPGLFISRQHLIDQALDFYLTVPDQLDSHFDGIIDYRSGYRSLVYRR